MLIKDLVQVPTFQFHHKYECVNSVVKYLVLPPPRHLSFIPLLLVLSGRNENRIKGKGQTSLSASLSSCWSLFDAPCPLGDRCSNTAFLMGSRTGLPWEALQELCSTQFPDVADVIWTTICHSFISAYVSKCIL